MSKPLAPPSYVGKGAGRLLTGVARLSAHHMQQMLARAGWALPVLPGEYEAAGMGANIRIWPSGALQKLIRESMRPFARQHGFAFVRRTVLGRVHEDTLHIICFEAFNPGFRCTVAVQPLYVPADVIVLSLAYRPKDHSLHLGKTWAVSGTEDDASRDLVQLQGLLEGEGLPWLAEVGSPAGIASFIEAMAWQREPIWGLPAFLRGLYLGFSYLHIGRYDAAQKALAAAAHSLHGDGRPWAVRDRQLAERMRALARDEPDRVPAVLQEYIRETRASLRLR